MLVEPPATEGRRASRKADRRRQILDVAERSFFERGFAATAMSAIAADIGGSKTTLWSYFASKEALFEGVLDRCVGDFAGTLDEALLTGGSVGDALARFGRLFLDRILREDACALRRLIGAEGTRFPAIAQAYYDRGPRRSVERLTGYIAEQMAVGTLRAGDPATVARQFIALCKAGSFFDNVWHRLDGGPPDLARDVAQAVATFLRAWAVPAPDGASPDGAAECSGPV